MLISSCQIRNYKSFKDSEELKFTPGFNVIVGRNNVGKSALIEALSARFGSVPHRSLETVMHPDSPVDPYSTATLTFAIDPAECVSLLARRGEFQVQVGADHSSDDAAKLFLEYVSKPLRVRATFTDGNFTSCEAEGYAIKGTNRYMRFRFDQNVGRFVFVGGPFSGGAREQDFERLLAEGLRERIYVFRAERLNVGECAIGTNETLLPNAQNLAEALHLLQARNPARFQRFNKDVNIIFPEIQQVTSVPVEKGRARISIWSVDPETQRQDLAVPLSDCGTGIGQVLAMLYVVSTSEWPRTIIIDEPQSFLHPGAIRKLFDIFKRHPQHQYLVSTHSPTAVTSANPKTLILLRREGNETKSEVLNVNEASELRLFLSEIGARLSDVFGADRILWVEGRTEEVCFRIVVERVLKKELLGTEILGVLQVGDLEGRDKETALKIYEKLSKGRGLLPPALAFAFDREGRTKGVMEELEKESHRLLQFIPRKMYECYLLNPRAIAAVLNELEANRAEPVTEEKVDKWIKDKGRKFGYAAGADDWMKKADAAKLLNELFNDLTATRVRYDKVKHGVKLTEWIAQNSPSDFTELAAFLRPILDRR